MLEIINVSKQYDGKPLLGQINLVVVHGETLALLGASGSGKSTLLRIIAGLEKPESGDVRWDGKSILDIPVHRRKFGLVFQDYALFSHLTVEQNVAFGLSMQKVDPVRIHEITHKALEKVKMKSFAQRDVMDLSGGEQQRVALARTLASNPRLFMFDEPLAALDRNLRQGLVADLRDILLDAGTPAIYVTHDQEEAFTLADRLALLVDGKIIQTGTPQQVFQNPSSEKAARFLGLSNFIDAKKIIIDNRTYFRTITGDFIVHRDNPSPAMLYEAEVKLCLRKAEIYTGEYAENVITGIVKDSVFTEDGFRTALATTEGLFFRFLLSNSFQVGDQVKLFIPPDQINIFSVETP